MKPQAPAACAAFVGLDWADAQHASCVQAAGTARREFLHLEHRPAAIDAWAQSLHTRCNGPPVAVCLERKKGPRVSALCQDECLVLFPVTPLTVAQDREACTPSRATDAPTDAALQVALLLTHRDQLTALSPQSPTMRALAHRVAHRRRLVGDTVRLTHRLTRARKNSVPQVLAWLQDKDTAIFGDFLSRWPTLKAAPRARRATLAAFFQAHHVRAAAVIATRIQARKSATPLTMDAGVMAPTALLVHALVRQLRVTLPAIKDCDDARAQRAQAPPDCPLCDA